MARSKPEATVDEAKMDMTPVIDVVFNLLIFFMLTMDFIEEEGNLLAHLPKDQGLSKSQVIQKEMEEIRVRVIKKTKQDQTITVVGTKQISDPEIDPSGLISTLRGLVAANPKTPVIIDASRLAEFKYVIYILNSCEIAGVQEIKFAGKPID